MKTRKQVYEEVKEKAKEIRTELPKAYGSQTVTIPQLPDQIVDPYSLGLLKNYILALVPHREDPMSIHKPVSILRTPTDLEMVKSKILLACAEAHELYTDITGKTLYVELTGETLQN